MNRNEFFEKIKSILAKELEKDPEKIQPESHLIDDLEFDSLDAFDFFNALSEQYKIEIDASMASEIKTISDILDFLETTLGSEE